MTDWTTDAADAIERAVALVRERTVDPARAFVKGVVYGILATLIGVPALFLVLVLLFRGLVELLGGEVWAAWCTLGGIFLLASWLSFSRRK